MKDDALQKPNLQSPEVVGEREKSRVGRLLAPVTRRARNRLETLRDGAIGELARRGVETLYRTMTDPENVERLQTLLARIGQFGMERGFEADPDAALLYEFVTWVEEEHAAEVAAIVAEENPFLDGSLLQLVENVLSAWSDDPESTHQLLEKAQITLLRLICRLAALELGDAPALEGKNQREYVKYFEALEPPERFVDLPAHVLGEKSAIEPAASRAVPRERSTKRALTRFLPGLDDPSVRFVLRSYPFFLHAYLARNLVEKLPDLVSATVALEKEYEATDALDITGRLEEK